MRQSETQNNNILHGFYPFIPCKCGGRNNITFGTWQQEAPYQHKGQIKILLRRVLALTYGTKLRCFLKMQDNMCIQRERTCEGYKTSQDTSKIHVPIGSI